MLRKGLLFLLVLVLSVNLAFALTPNNGNSTKGKLPIPCKAIGPDDEFSALDFPATYYPPLYTDVIGEVITAGYTWYDIQHNSSCGRQIQIDDPGNVHISWMKGFEAGAITRHIFYQAVTPTGGLVFTTPDTGVQVDVLNRAGFTTLALYSGGNAVPNFHQGAGGDYNFHTAIGMDIFPLGGIFIVEEPPWVFEPGGDDMEVIWPHIAADRNDRFHMFSTFNPPAAGNVHGHYYSRATFSWTEYRFLFNGPQELVSM
ncbi:hypothetical protein ISS30_09860, partial [bacterium]|nr:hypothetical protein [bacterium]